MSPYDIAILAGKVKDRGLNLAEEEVKMVVKEVLGWVRDSASASPTPFDDVLLAVIPHVEKLALDLADKIDGQPGA